ncbi:tagaturonate reductase [Pseudovibrio exalbescens]|uniref:Altronate oxidoreductase n=1 Tax=Pseudovibrio exalbescens TaxID=197461 RepID=A0A1U7JGH1_9HYPH|nr:tagaturonate reductase [Pseudovibrio exalbescens]OKL43795.1 altronate oxidoreductase [Pseudovibrio exalbescens]
MERISAGALNGRPRPTERVIQFGEGNFLRAFIDWKIDRMNEEVGADYGVVIVRPIDGGIPHSLNDSGGVYTVLSRGVGADGSAVSEARAIAAIRREISAVSDWEDTLALAREPNFVAVVSNTTEAGITYNGECQANDAPPASFPAKVTRLLMERYSTCGRDEAPGLQFLPCELIDKNGDTLEKIVLQHAQDWELSIDFQGWVKTKCAFYNTMVDRIVPGYPRDEAESIEMELGYHDPLMVTAELFHFLVIEKRQDQPELVLPLAEKDAGTIITENAEGYKERKVAILNGAHTALCPLALLAGVETVREAMDNAPARAFLDALIQTEIMPHLSLPQDELKVFAEEVLRRFANPFIQHRWYDISLNGLAKFHTRNLPRLKKHWAATGVPPKLMSLSLAAWLAFYIGDFPGAEELPPRDAKDVVQRMNKIAQLKGEGDVEALVGAFLGDECIWGQSMADEELIAEVANGYRFLTAEAFSLNRLTDWCERQ